MKTSLTLLLITTAVLGGCSSSGDSSATVQTEASASVPASTGVNVNAAANDDPSDGDDQSMAPVTASNPSDASTASTPTLNPTSPQQTEVNDDCIGVTDSEGVRFCVNPETRLFSATTADGNLWWSFVLPGDNRSNEIEAVFEYDNQIGLLADTMPELNTNNSPDSKINPYEVSLFYRGGEFISTTPLIQDLRQQDFNNAATVQHQASEQFASVVVLDSGPLPQFLMAWERGTSTGGSLYDGEIGVVLTRYDLSTGLPITQFEADADTQTMWLGLSLILMRPPTPEYRIEFLKLPGQRSSTRKLKAAIFSIDTNQCTSPETALQQS